MPKKLPRGGVVPLAIEGHDGPPVPGGDQRLKGSRATSRQRGWEEQAGSMLRNA
jgi:hypothetical protein